MNRFQLWRSHGSEAGMAVGYGGGEIKVKNQDRMMARTLRGHVVQ